MPTHHGDDVYVAGGNLQTPGAPVSADGEGREGSGNRGEG